VAQRACGGAGKTSLISVIVCECVCFCALLDMRVKFTQSLHISDINCWRTIHLWQKDSSMHSFLIP
jgi:hypothetical protein